MFGQPAIFYGITGFIAMFLWPIAGGAFVTWKLCRVHPRNVKWFLEHWIGMAMAGVLITALLRFWSEALGYGTSGAVAMILYFIWKHRHKGKKVAKELGAKARARIEKLVRDMPRPGPGLRPVPVPVRW